MTTSDVELAPLQIADLDPARLRDLATDVAALGEELEVRVKRREGYVDPEARRGLDDAVAELLSGGAMAVQLRYRFDGRIYWDTLLAMPHGFRLVRTDVTTSMGKDSP